MTELNTAVNLEPQTDEGQEAEKVSVFSHFAQALSNPVNMWEYLGDKAITGLVTTGVFYGTTAIGKKIKEARALRKQQEDLQVK